MNCTFNNIYVSPTFNYFKIQIKIEASLGKLVDPKKYSKVMWYSVESIQGLWPVSVRIHSYTLILIKGKVYHHYITLKI